MGALTSTLVLNARTGSPPERFTAFAVSPGGPRTSAVATPVDITIDRWSTPDETRKLMQALQQKGPRGDARDTA